MSMLLDPLRRRRLEVISRSLAWKSTEDAAMPSRIAFLADAFVMSAAETPTSLNDVVQKTFSFWGEGGTAECEGALQADVNIHA